MRKQNSGVMLLEAMIAILIFSLGILGVVGMQASAVAASRDAKYRSDAGLLADELVGEMMSTSPRDGATLQTLFQGDCDDALACSHVADGARFLAWRTRVRNTLPGVVANDPYVYVGPVNAGWAPASGCPLGGPLGGLSPTTSTQVCIVVRWQAPNDTAAHNYIVVVHVV